MVNLRVVQKCQTTMVIPFLIVFLTILVDLTTAQQLPDMPGPPYPDRWGNNRWGVKYDPRVHGRGRPSHHQSSSASSPGPWGGARNNNFQHQQHRPVEDEPVRYRGGGSSSSSSPPSSSRGKWGPGLKPIVSSLKKYRDIYRNKRQRASSSSFNPTSDSFNRDSIDRYVKNYMNHYNNVAQIPSAPSDLVSIQNFARPIDLSSNFRSSDRRSSRGHTSLHTPTSRYSAAEPTTRSKAVYRTYNPQPDFLVGQNRKTSTIHRNFAKTLSNIYNDYQPGAENTHNSFDSERISSSSAGSSVAASDAISNSIIVADDDSYPPSPSLRPRPSAVRGSSYSSTGGKPPKRRRRPTSSSSVGSRRPLSALDLYEDTQAGYSPGVGPSAVYSESVSGGISYSGPRNVGSYSSGSPLSSYSFSGAPSSSSYSGPPSMSSYSPSSPFDPFSSGPATLSHPVSSFDSYGQVPAAPVPQYSMPSPDSYFPAPTQPPKRKSKRKKSILQHTPMNVLRGLLGRDRGRDRDREYNKAYANLPHLSSAYGGPQIPTGPPPQVPQYSYNPLANTIANGLDFFGGPRQPGFGAPGQPPYGRPPPKGAYPFSFNGKPRPQGHPGPRLPPKSIIDLLDDANSGQEKGNKEPYKTHYSNWPQIFTAVGSGVDAVAGGVHAIRKEISKMTGEAMAKGIMMGGTAVHEVSKGMASMISKMSTI